MTAAAFFIESTTSFRASRIASSSAVSNDGPPCDSPPADAPAIVCCITYIAAPAARSNPEPPNRAAPKPVCICISAGFMPRYTPAVAELKTKATKASVTEFLNSIADDERRADCKTLLGMMTKATKAKPVMWGPAIVGFGDHEYTGANGKPNRWFQAGFSPRKQALTLYLMGGSDKQLLAKLGAHTTGAACLYVKRLEDVHWPTLQKLIVDSVNRLKKLKK